ncbi:MAG: M28 family metallopeptidase [Terracidiphilus sp.]
MTAIKSTLALGLALISLPCLAQPDYLQYGAPLAPAAPDPAIAKALTTIQPAHIQQTIETLVGFGTRSTLSSMSADLPQDKGINAAANWIYGQFEAISHECGGCLEVKRDVFTADQTSGGRWAGRIPRPTQITNVYAILRGSDPAEANRMVLVTGHYDSRNLNVFDDHGTAPGANDDASGVAVSLECARTLSKLHLPATIVFAAVAGEEQGLIGSGHLAQLARQEGWQLEGVLNNDIVGGNTTPGDTQQLKDRVRVFSEGIPATATADEERRIHALGGENDSPSRELARAIAAAARTYFANGGSTPGFSAFLVARPDRYLRGGDHMTFNQEGFAAVRLTEWQEDFNHQHQNIVRPAAGSNAPVLGDLLEFVDFHYVAQVARLNAATLATLAAAPGPPEHVKIEMKGLENGTTLTWEAPTGGRVAHYQVVWRETTAPDWQYGKTVDPPAAGSDVRVTVPISKDNVVFGVRSVDAQGHASLVKVPLT